MEWYKQDKNVTEIPIIAYYGGDYKAWFNHLNSVFFFKNQDEVFSCFLFTMNKSVFLSYNPDIKLSHEYMKFVLAFYPKNYRDKKRRYFKNSVQ